MPITGPKFGDSAPKPSSVPKKPEKGKSEPSRFFTAISYTWFFLCILDCLVALFEVFGMKPLGEALFTSAGEAFVDLVLTGLCAVSVSMIIQRRKRGLVLLNASLGANMLFIFKTSSDSPLDVVFAGIIVLMIYLYYNRKKVKDYLAS